MNAGLVCGSFLPSVNIFRRGYKIRGRGDEADGMAGHGSQRTLTWHEVLKYCITVFEDMTMPLSQPCLASLDEGRIRRDARRCLHERVEHNTSSPVMLKRSQGLTLFRASGTKRAFSYLLDTRESLPSTWPANSL